jgi:DNA topoisomerase-6 subunit B
VYRGNPFQIEVGLAYGGQLPTDDSARIIRFANRVPLLYQPSACCISKSLIEVNWRNYAVGQPRNSIPEGPLVIFVHMASVWVPFTSESKEAIADYDEIRKEIKLAVMDCGRRLNTYIRRRQRMAREGQKRHVFEKYIGEVVRAISGMTQVDEVKLHGQLTEIAKGFTETADMQFDENGNPIKEETVGRVDDKVLIIEANVADRIQAALDEAGEKPKAGKNLFGSDEE